MKKIKIDTARDEDISEIEKLETEYGFEIYSKNEIENMLNNPLYKLLVAKDEYNKVCGYLCATCIFENCDLLKIIVSKDYRQSGIGNMLLKSLITIAKNEGCEKIILEVRTSNTVAISFYEKNGFEFEYKRDNYYNNEDAKIYRLNLL